jgi:hypothetical protein
MGKQFGPVHLSGQYADIRMVIDNGRGRAHLSKTVTKQQIMTSASYQTTRENMKEFEGAAQAAKSFRKCLGTRVKGFGDRYMMARLMGKMRSVISRGNGPGGQRTFELAPQVSLLRDFQLNRHEAFEGRFQAGYTLTADANRNGVVMDIPVFDTQLGLDIPQGATHFRVFLTVGLLSDLNFVAAQSKYVEVVPTLDGLNGFADSGILSARGMTAANISLHAQIAGVPAVGVGVNLVAAAFPPD